MNPFLEPVEEHGILVVAHDHDGLRLEVLLGEHLRGVPGGVLPDGRHGLLDGVHRLVRHLVRLVVKLLKMLICWQ